MEVLSRSVSAVISDTGLFVLKTLAIISTAAFGIYGLDVKSRDGSGNFTRQGKVVLIGLIVSALITGITQTGEFFDKQKSAADEILRSRQVMASIQRNLYLMKDVRAELQFTFKYDSGDAKEFKKKAKAILATVHGKDCNAVLPSTYPGTGCSTSLIGSKEVEYEELSMRTTAKDFPSAGSDLFTIITSLEARVDFYPSKFVIENPPESHAARGIIVDMGDKVPEGADLRYDVKTDDFTYHVWDVPIPQPDVARSGVLSLIDILDGSVVAFIDLSTTLDECETETCNNIYGQLWSGAAVEVTLKFPFPKVINVNSEGIAHLKQEWIDGSIKVQERRVYYTNLPNDIEKIDEIGRLLP